MKYTLLELKKRNEFLYYFGWVNFTGALLCIPFMWIDNTMILGINAWIKPMKFFLSIGIYCWTMGWLLFYLNAPGKIKPFNYMVLVVFVFEQSYICFQAATGQKSHFNFSSASTILLYSLMGLAITILVVWTAYFAFLFFRKKFPQLTGSYLWGIRCGIVIFVFFSMGAHFMASSVGHTVGAPDGSSGLPFVNWSTTYGDLRAAHFFGMHALQLLPLFGYYISHNARTTIIVSIIYFVVCVAVFVQAIAARPLLSI
jgi:hypothetical protein